MRTNFQQLLMESGLKMNTFTYGYSAEKYVNDKIVYFYTIDVAWLILSELGY